MAKLIAIAGLPGSGKSRYIARVRGTIAGVIADDYMTHAHGDSPIFTNGRRFVELARALNAGKDCLVSDINFCRPNRRAEFESAIRGVAPGTEFEWRFFENDPDRCIGNVRRRARINVTREEQTIRDLSPHFQIPAAATVLPVWTPASGPGMASR